MFIVTYINYPAFDPFGFYFNADSLIFSANIDVMTLLAFFIITLPATFTTANITFANNICDIEWDKGRRFTMPHHIGLKKSLYFFAALYYATYAAILTGWLIGALPVWSLFTLLTIIIIQKNIRAFFKKQKKPDTFVLAINNFMLIISVFGLTLFIAGIFEYWL